MGKVAKFMERIFEPNAPEKKFNVRMGRVLAYLSHGVLDGVRVHQVPSVARVLEQVPEGDLLLLKELHQSMNQKEVVWHKKPLKDTFFVNDMAIEYKEHKSGQPIGDWGRLLPLREKHKAVRYSFRIHAPKTYQDSLAIYSSHLPEVRVGMLRFEEEWSIRGKIKLYLFTYAEQLSGELDSLLRIQSEERERSEEEKHKSLKQYEAVLEKKLAPRK